MRLEELEVVEVGVVHAAEVRDDVALDPHPVLCGCLGWGFWLVKTERRRRPKGKIDITRTDTEDTICGHARTS